MNSVGLYPPRTIVLYSLTVSWQDLPWTFTTPPPPPHPTHSKPHPSQTLPYMHYPSLLWDSITRSRKWACWGLTRPPANKTPNLSTRYLIYGHMNPIINTCHKYLKAKSTKIFSISRLESLSSLRNIVKDNSFCSRTLCSSEQVRLIMFSKLFMAPSN